MEYQLDGYCGLYCGACPVLLASQAGTGEVTCQGCKSDQIKAGWCSVCTLKACAREKGLDFCYQCEQYPCEDLEAFKTDLNYPYHQEIYAYMEVIAQEGKAAWLEQIKTRWTCPQCGQKASWWDLACKNCGQALNGYQNPNPQ